MTQKEASQAGPCPDYVPGQGSNFVPARGLCRQQGMTGSSTGLPANCPLKELGVTDCTALTPKQRAAFNKLPSSRERAAYEASPKRTVIG